MSTAAMAQPSTEFQVAEIFSDHMVLQRGGVVPVWGRDQPGQRVVVQFGGREVAATADEAGHWRAALPAMEASGEGRTLTVTGSGEARFVDVLVGDIWLCAGQSNMLAGLGGKVDSEAAIAAAGEFPLVRVSDSAAGGWQVPSPENARQFSAVAYWFGKRLHQELGVPIGLVTRAEGGLRAQAFISRWALASEPTLKRRLLDPWEGFEQSLAWRRAELAEAPKALRDQPLEPFGTKQAPGRFFDQAIAPLIPFAIRGAVYYQGESDGPSFDMAELYEAQLAALIRDWRARWQRPDLPFVVVQLPELPAPRPLVRDPQMPREPAPWNHVQVAQASVARTLENVGLAVNVDTGVKNIHPGEKKPVGQRAALAALGVAYGQNIAFSGPVFSHVTREDGALRLHFDHTHGGLAANDGKLTGFTVAGRDRLFYWADATIEGDTVIVRSPAVPEPAAARYLFSEQALWSLKNGAGLLASPFRTDDWHWDIPAPPRRIAAAQAAAAPTIDGKLDEPAWRDAAPVEGFYRVHSYHQEADTSAKVTWDAQNLYVAFDCQADGSPRAAAAKDDEEAIWLDDHVDVVVDPQNDGRNYRLLVVNAAGARLDLAGYSRTHEGDPLVTSVLDHQRHTDPSWQSNATIATARTEGGWSAEIALPWASLGVDAPRPGQRIGLQLERSRDEKRSQWQLTGRSRSTAKMLPLHYVDQVVRWHEPERFGTLVLE